MHTLTTQHLCMLVVVDQGNTRAHGISTEFQLRSPTAPIGVQCRSLEIATKSPAPAILNALHVWRTPMGNFGY